MNKIEVTDSFSDIYCEACGTKLDRLLSDIIYSHKTGKPYKNVVQVRCPNKAFFLSKHTDLVPYSGPF